MKMSSPHATGDAAAAHCRTDQYACGAAAESLHEVADMAASPHPHAPPDGALRELGRQGRLGSGRVSRPPRYTAQAGLQRALFGAFWTSGQERMLTAEERTLLHQLRPSSPAAAQDCILFSDPNKDPDDVVSFVMAKQLEMLGLARVGHVVTTLGPQAVRAERAMLAKGVFGALGMPGVGVAIGRDYEIGARQADHGSFLSRGTPLCAEHAGVGQDSLAGMRQSLRDASGKVTLIAIAGMTDANALLMKEPDLVRQKVGRVVVMGGIARDKDDQGLVCPDDRAYNNHTDLAAAHSFYRLAQQYEIPLRVVCKEAAYKAAVSPRFYDALAASGHPVGGYLRDIQKESLKTLWDRIGKREIGKLDERWFYSTFIARSGDAAGFEQWHAQRPPFEQIWGQVERLNLYDPLTLLAALDAPSQMLFKPLGAHAPDKPPVEVIGAEEVTSPDAARTLMAALSKLALATEIGYGAR
ncbi:type III secretion system effector XopQ [Xanthomonas translucens]|nr:type III secretion system effector XopQ [Xanthomonas translucens]